MGMKKYMHLAYYILKRIIFPLSSWVGNRLGESENSKYDNGTVEESSNFPVIAELCVWESW